MRAKIGFVVLTNNPLVLRQYDELKLVPVDGDAEEVYIKARNLVHKGHRLLSHPLSGNIKPGLAPYRTIVLTEEADRTVDLDSLNYMSAALEAVQRTGRRAAETIPAAILNDYAAVDLSIFESALLSLQA
ncbi:MAG: hypothetical protein GX952_02025 [Firmicutes bacterium]|nr:hypothetical protein [Bacillota bacterium]